MHERQETVPALEDPEDGASTLPEERGKERIVKFDEDGGSAWIARSSEAEMVQGPGSAGRGASGDGGGSRNGRSSWGSRSGRGSLRQVDIMSSFKAVEGRSRAGSARSVCRRTSLRFNTGKLVI